MPAHDPIVVRSLADLRHLPTMPEINGFGIRRRIVLDIAGVGREPQDKWERSLNRYQMRCGCMPAGMTILLVMLIGGYRLAVAPSAPAALEFEQIGYLLLAALAAGFAAKGVVLTATKLQFWIAVRRVVSESIKESGK